MSYSTRAYQLTKEEYYYLLPILRNRVLNRNKPYTILTKDIDTVLNHLKELYTNYIEELPPTLSYKCSKKGSIQPFRDFMELLQTTKFKTLDSIMENL